MKLLEMASRRQGARGDPYWNLIVHLEKIELPAYGISKVNGIRERDEIIRKLAPYNVYVRELFYHAMTEMKQNFKGILEHINLMTEINDVVAQIRSNAKLLRDMGEGPLERPEMPKIIKNDMNTE